MHTQVNVLVVDEISMIDAEILEKIEAVARACRGSMQVTFSVSWGHLDIFLWSLSEFDKHCPRISANICMGLRYKQMCAIKNWRILGLHITADINMLYDLKFLFISTPYVFNIHNQLIYIEF